MAHAKYSMSPGLLEYSQLTCGGLVLRSRPPLKGWNHVANMRFQQMHVGSEIGFDSEKLTVEMVVAL